MTQRFELDDVDRSLITELVSDGRATYAKLAPVVGLSQAAVRTRVQRLLDEHVITVTGRVDPGSLGLGVFAFVFLEVTGTVDEVLTGVDAVDDAVFVAVGAGRFDLLVEVRCVDNDHLLEALDDIRALDGVRRLQTATVLQYAKHDWTGVGNRDAAPAPAPTVALSHELDEVDHLLLRALMADGRATYASLAPAVGLSQAAARDRVIDLLETNVVTIHAHPVAEAMGIAGFAGVAIKATGQVKQLVDTMASMPETTLVARTVGRYDVLAEIWFDDQVHLIELLDQMGERRGVGAIDTVPYLRIAKEDFASGFRR